MNSYNTIADLPHKLSCYYDQTASGGYHRENHNIIAQFAVLTYRSEWYGPAPNIRFFNSGYSGSDLRPSDTQLQNQFFTLNNIDREATTIYEGETTNYSVIQEDIYCVNDFYAGVTGSIGGEIPLFCTEEDYNTYKGLIAPELQFDSINFVNVGDQISYYIPYVVQAHFPMAYEEYVITEIFHDVYIYGPAGMEVVEIISHHNVQNGQVKVNQYNGGRLPGGEGYLYKFFENPEKVTIPYFDKPSDVTASMKAWEIDLINEGLFKSSQVKKDDFYYGVYFKDDIIINGQTLTKYSQLGFFNATDDTTQDQPVFPTDENVHIRFFRRKPTEEEKEGGDDEEAPDDYGPSDTPQKPGGEDPSYEEGSQEGSLGLFHQCYNISNEELKKLRKYLWSEAYFDVLKINENPMDNIISVKRLPIEAGGDTASILIGNLNSGVVGSVVGNGVQEIDFQYIEIGGKTASFLDYYQTSIGIYLPYIGFKQLDTKTWMNKSLYLYYKVDIVSGECKAILGIGTSKTDMKIVNEYTGSMGIDCAMSASNQKQTELSQTLRYANAGIGIGGAIGSGVIQMAGGNPAGGALSMASGVASGVTGLLANTQFTKFESTPGNASIATSTWTHPMIIYDYPCITENDFNWNKSMNPVNIYPSYYAHAVGIPVAKSYPLSDFRNLFVKVAGDFDLARPATPQIELTENEINAIKALLQEGVVI